MRKVLILALICLLSYLAYDAVINGGDLLLEAKGYQEIEEANTELDMLIEQLNQKNSIEYSTKRDALNVAVQDYERIKAEYEDLASTQKQMAYESTDLYDLEFLWTELGNYARENQVIMKMNIGKSTTAMTDSAEYVICDLDFDVIGGYIKVTDFLYALEDDDRFAFEICEFSMVKANSSDASQLFPSNTPTDVIQGAVNAKFKVKGLPVNASTVSTFATDETQESTDAGMGTMGAGTGFESVTPVTPVTP